MIIKSTKKKDIPINLNIINTDGSSYSLERKQCIKYLGDMIDESLSWKHHISFVCSPMSRTTGIISKLRYYLFCSHISLGKCIQNTYKKNSSKTKSYCKINIFCQIIWQRNRESQTFAKSTRPSDS